MDEIQQLRAELAAKDGEIARLREGTSKDNDEICQILGVALGYPRFCDDQENFAGSTEAAGVCVGEHVAASIAAEAAKKITRLREALAAETEANDRLYEDLSVLKDAATEMYFAAGSFAVERVDVCETIDAWNDADRQAAETLAVRSRKAAP